MRTGEKALQPNMPKAVRRANFLALGSEAPDDELRGMGEADSATRSKASRVALFKDWLLKRGTEFPVGPEQLQMFAAQLTI